MRQRVQHLIGSAVIAAVVLVAGTTTAAVAGVGAGAKDDGFTGTVWTGWNDGGGRGSNCVFAADDHAALSGSVQIINGVEHRLYTKYCDGTFVDIVWIPAYTPGDVLVLARQQIERTLPKPTPLMVWPDRDFDWAYAQVPIDFRVEPAEWATFEDTATAATPVETVSVTIRAEPATLTLTSGDPNGRLWETTCDGEHPLAAYDPYVPGACSYTYINSSTTARNGRFFAASMGISWNIRYWSTTHPGFAGTLPAITRETQFPVEVAEVKILSTTKYP